MKSLKYFFVAISFMLVCSISQGQRIAVINFNAGAGISQTDVDGISSIFNTYFMPKGYTLVERTQIDRVINEQGFQRGSFTQTEMVRLGEILNVSKVVVGDISIIMGEYNVDVRVVDVRSGSIVAKDGMSWNSNSSYREMMKQLADRISAQIEALPMDREPEKAIKLESSQYRKTGHYLSFAAGVPHYFTIAYRYQMTPSIAVGGGAGFGDVSCNQTSYWLNESNVWEYSYSDPDGRSGVVPIFAEIDLRTPKHKWSLFLNAKLGFNIYTEPEKFEDYYFENVDNDQYFFDFDSPNLLHISAALGVSYKYLNFGIGYSNSIAYDVEEFPYLFLSYSLPLETLF